jgi:nucleotide-binding universal stress UspA family protein
MAEPGGTAPTLVVGHSQDPSSDYALTAAVDLARRVGGRLHVVHAIETKDYPVDSDAADWEQQGAAVIAEQRRRVEARLRDAGVPRSYEPPCRPGKRTHAGGDGSVRVDDRALGHTWRDLRPAPASLVVSSRE